MGFPTTFRLSTSTNLPSLRLRLRWQLRDDVGGPGAAADDEFGTSVAIFKKLVVVGSFHGEAAYVFPRSANYEYAVTLAAADDAKGFGRAVAVDGDKIVVGAPAGEAAYVFRATGGWDTDTPDYAYTKLTATDAIDENNFERICLYLLRSADFMSDPDDHQVEFHRLFDAKKSTKTTSR